MKLFKQKHIVLLIFSFFFLLRGLNLYAETPETNPFEAIFGNDQNMMNGLSHGTSIFSDIIRSIGWFFIVLMQSLVDGLSGVVNNILSIDILSGAGNDFFYYKWIDNAKIIGIALASLVIVVLGIIILVQGHKKLESIFIKIVLMFVMIIFLFPAAQKFQEFVFVPAVKLASSDGSTSLGSDIITTNTIDIEKSLVNGEKTYLYDGELSVDEEVQKQQKNYIAKGGVPQKKVDQDKIPEEYKGLINNINPDGNYTVREMGDGWWGIGKEDLYRYHYNFGIIFISLAVIAVAVALFSVRVAKFYLFEIPFAIITSIFFFIPISGTQKMFKIVNEIMTIFLGIIFSVLAFSFYISMNAYLGIVVDDFWTQIIIQLGLASALISGSSFVNKILGFDIGVQDGYQSLLGTKAALDMAGSAGGAVGRAIGGLFGGAKSQKEGVEKQAEEMNKDFQNNLMEAFDEMNSSEDGIQNENLANDSIDFDKYADEKGEDGDINTSGSEDDMQDLDLADNNIDFDKYGEGLEEDNNDSELEFEETDFGNENNEDDNLNTENANLEDNTDFESDKNETEDLTANKEDNNQDELSTEEQQANSNNEQENLSDDNESSENMAQTNETKGNEQDFEKNNDLGNEETNNSKDLESGNKLNSEANIEKVKGEFTGEDEPFMGNRTSPSLDDIDNEHQYDTDENKE